ncbi:hypothetical protein I7I50_07208 [Histoplasma capsulatum G186AR]|uniref:Uncharacterized protein n=1 Tax=Ajellomyces capsulatus TaxID=5037 RepID=A0A8H7Z1C7_AJECA|nr:hypothetical protein I7I52_09720 [Histoplasma capsulatum]QSS67964.1 hypothetical protein I7I50_07208 [Histoplasma capsulatum G186AR]
MRDALERLERMERIRGAGRCRYNCADTGVQYVVRVVRGQRGDEMIMSRERSNTHNIPIYTQHSQAFIQVCFC